MLNYANLNPEDFEALCRDIMERELDISLRRFGQGRDGGIDLTEDVESHRIVIQVKHYPSSTASALVSKLKQEKEKVEKLNPAQYYICCSRQLSVENIRELYETFRPWMDSDRNIFTLTEIDDFLKDPKNDDIFRKNYKLWFSDPRVLEMLETQDIFMDCQWVLDEIEEDLPVFVKTQAYGQALEMLKASRLLCITGDPGTGKSMTSRMLAAAYVAQGYRLRFTSNVTDLGPLKRSVSADPEVKELILLDDCFGQAYFEMQSSQNLELLTLIHHVKRNPNKVLILNSRITILNEAREKQPRLVKCLENKELNLCRLDTNHASEEEKARILYSHLYHRDLPQTYIDEITKDRRYRDIIRHKNYNPRVLEFVCTPSHYRDISPEGYWDFVLTCLNNPTEIWKDEYENRLLPVDRILLQTLYSLEYCRPDETRVRWCFQYRIKDDPLIDKTADPFPQALQRLSESMISIQYKNGRKYLSMINPSVNDFLMERLIPGSTEYENLVRYICDPSQIEALIPAEEYRHYVSELLVSAKLDQFYFSDKNCKDAVIAEWIIISTLCVPQYRSAFQNALEHQSELAAFFFSQILPDVLGPTEVWNCYELDVFYAENDHLYNQLMNLSIYSHFLALPTTNSEIHLYVPFPVIETSIVDILNTIYPLFHENQKSSINSQIRHWLADIQTKILSIDLANQRPALTLDLFEEETSPFYWKVAKLSVPVTQKIQETICSNFQYAREHLPLEFQDLCYFDDPKSIEILGLKKYLEVYESASAEVKAKNNPTPPPLDIDALFHSPIDSTPNPC